ncbi:MAG TPA: hypothetical protein VMT89_16220, partial [Candidatus Acidoferrales bacterium]|nr:hypothetical protein [Candidatus Acidoferrales bacterium]
MSRVQWAALVAVLLVALLPLLTGAQPLDDALITLRYARSLAEGAGFVFNPGEHVQGTTTPLFTILLAALHRLTGADLIPLSYLVACSCHLGGMIVLALAGASCGFPWVGVAAAGLFGLAPIALNPVAGCMETSFFILTVLVALSPVLPFASRWRTLAAAAALLTRPEGTLVVTLYALELIAVDRRLGFRRLLLLALLVIPWFTFATIYFGSPLPQSVHAKWSNRFLRPPLIPAEQFWYLLISLPTAAPRIQLQSFVALPFGSLIATTIPLAISLAARRVMVLLVGAAVLMVCAVGGVALCRHSTAVRRLILFAVLYVAAFCLARPPMFSWYLTPPLPILMLSFVAGSSIVGAFVARRAEPLLAATTLAFMIALSCWQSWRFLNAYPATVRVRGYQAAVESLGLQAQDP